MAQTNRTEVALIISEYLKEELQTKGHHWQPTNQNQNTNDLILNSAKRRNVVNCLCTLSQSMRASFSEQLRQMCAKLDNEVADLTALDYESFQDVANELFSQGIMWGHIICLLVFGSELILSTIDENPSRALIENIAQYLSNYINANLLTWINDHEAWNGLIIYSNQHSAPFESTVDGLFKKFSWHDSKFLKVGAAIGVVGILVCVLISKSK